MLAIHPPEDRFGVTEVPGVDPAGIRTRAGPRRAALAERAGRRCEPSRRRPRPSTQELAP